MQLEIDKTVLRDLAYNYEAQRDWVLVQLCDIGVTSTPFEFRQQELRTYLIDSCKRSGILNFYSKVTGIPLIDKVSYLKYLSHLKLDSEFKSIVLLAIQYYELDERLNQIYDYDKYILLGDNSHEKDTITVKTYKKPDEKGLPVYNVKGFNSPYMVRSYNLARAESLAPIYYKYFSRVSNYVLAREETFMVGLSRKQEEDFLDLIIEGHLTPTNPNVLEVWSDYVANSRYSIYKDLKLFLEEFLEETQLSLKSNEFINFITPYQIGVSSTLQIPVNTLTIPPLIHVEGQLPMLSATMPSMLNLLRGVGGLLTPDENATGIYVPVLMRNGKYKTMIKKRSESRLLYSDYKPDDFLNALASCGFQGRLVNVNREQATRAINQLEKRGFSWQFKRLGGG